MAERGRLPASTRLAAGRPSLSLGAKEKSVSWLFSTKPSTIRPEPNTLSTEVVMETTFPWRSTTTKCEVPPASRVASAPATDAPGGSPGAGAGPAVSSISLARWSR